MVDFFYILLGLIIPLTISVYHLTIPHLRFSLASFSGLFIISFINIPLYVIKDDLGISDDAFVFLIFSFLCYVALITGHYNGFKKAKFNKVYEYYNHKIFLLITFLYIVIGGFFFQNNIEFLLLSGFSEGIATFNNFFVNFIKIAFILSVFHFYRNKSKIALIFALISVIVYYVPSIFIFFKRGAIMELICIPLIIRYFYTSKSFSSLSILTFFFLAFVFFLNTSSIRNITTTNENISLSNFSDLNYFKGLDDFFNKGTSEVKAGVIFISHVAKTSNYDFGLYHWNRLVFNFFPAQIFGKYAKESLQFQFISSKNSVNKYSMYEIGDGTTVTGFSDSYASFGFFGFIKFYLIGFVMGSILKKSLLQSFYFQLLYVFLFVSSLHTLTHNTQWILSTFIYFIIFIYPVYKILVYKSHSNILRK